MKKSKKKVEAARRSANQGRKHTHAALNYVVHRSANNKINPIDLGINP
jgi:hypothetical protein